jgi:hypothetical protein
MLVTKSEERQTHKPAEKFKPNSMKILLLQVDLKLHRRENLKSRIKRVRGANHLTPLKHFQNNCFELQVSYYLT